MQSCGRWPAQVGMAWGREGGEGERKGCIARDLFVGGLVVNPVQTRQ